MKIGVVGIRLSKENTGIGNYTINLINKLAEISNVKIYLFTTLDINELSNINLKINMISINDKYKSRYFKPIAEQIIILKYIKKYSIDLLFCPFYISPLLTKTKTVVTVHDMIYKEKNDGKNILKDTYRNIFFSLSILKAEKIITVSDFTKQEILRYFPSKKNIFVTPLGTIQYQKEILIKPQNINVDDKFALIVGTISPRKNIINTVKALEKIKDLTKLKLVIAGGTNNSSAKIVDYLSNSCISDRIILTGYISDEELAWCYKNAEMLLFCSLYEGFGLPPLEAMISETPVISSNITSIPEVVGNAGILVDPYNIDEISSAILKLENNSQFKNYLITRGLERYKLFTWEKTAEMTLEIFRS